MYYMFNKFNPSSKSEGHTIKEWELQLGIKVVDPKGFREPNNKVHTTQYTRRGFKRGVKASIITCKTKKGLEFLNSF